VAGVCCGLKGAVTGCASGVTADGVGSELSSYDQSCGRKPTAFAVPFRQSRVSPRGARGFATTRSGGIFALRSALGIDALRFVLRKRSRRSQAQAAVLIRRLPLIWRAAYRPLSGFMLELMDIPLKLPRIRADHVRFSMASGDAGVAALRR
jgi:hypothetical protein